MKTYLLSLAFVVVVVASVCNAACVRDAMRAMGRVNVALAGR